MIKLSGHNPDTFGHAYITQSNLTFGYFTLDTYMHICQYITKLFTDSMMNPEIIRTYPDISQIGFNHRSNSKH